MIAPKPSATRFRITSSVSVISWNSPLINCDMYGSISAFVCIQKSDNKVTVARLSSAFSGFK